VLKLAACVIALGATLACSDSTDPDVADVVGSYEATSFTTTSSGVVDDELADGAALEMVLNANGSVTGLLTAPTGEGGGTLNMAGTWSLSGNTVTFDQSADSFVRDMPFTVAGNTLSGDATFDGVRVRVTLTKQ
jgi:hypothetical protein